MGLKVDIIVAITNLPAFAARGATATIPIVVWAAHDAIGTGLVDDLAHPVGNVAGTESLAAELDAKRIELLKQIVPALKFLAVLYNPDDQGSRPYLKWAQSTGERLGFSILQLEMRKAADYDNAFTVANTRPLGGLLMLTDSVVAFQNWNRAANFALKAQLPTVCEFSQFVDAGCLVSYGPTFDEFSDRAALQVDRILKGARPSSLPVEQPTRFELVVNLRTAKSIGVVIPQSVVLQATRLIE